MSTAEADEIIGDLFDAGLALARCRESVDPDGSVEVDRAAAALDRAIRALQLVALTAHVPSLRAQAVRTVDAGCREEPVQAARRVLGHVAPPPDAVASTS